MPSGFDFANVQGLTMSGNQSDCPRCGHFPATVIEGVFDVVGDAITMLSGPAWSRERLAALQRDVLAARADLRSQPPQAVAERLAAQHPTLKPYLRPEWIAVWIAVLALLLQGLDLATRDSFTPEELQQILDRVVHEQQPLPAAPPGQPDGCGDGRPNPRA